MLHHFKSLYYCRVYSIAFPEFMLLLIPAQSYFWRLRGQPE